MTRTLTAIWIALALYLLWQIGYIRKYEEPCGRYGSCQQAEAAAPEKVTPSEPVATVKESTPPPLDVARLCRAIAVAETSNCTKGSALSNNNCHGITKRSGGYVRYENHAQSFAACEDLWKRKYVRYPDLKLAAKWSSPGAAETWLKNVNAAYARLD